MKPGVVFATVLTVIGLAAVVFAFQSNSSSYVSVADAMTVSGDRLHLSGDIVAGTMKSSTAERLVNFDLRDQSGQTLAVVYRGMPPVNLGEATKVVAVGGVKDGKFLATKIITKCPSKYESAK